MPIPFFFLPKFTENCSKEFGYPENAISSQSVVVRASYLILHYLNIEWISYEFSKILPKGVLKINTLGGFQIGVLIVNI